MKTRGIGVLASIILATSLLAGGCALSASTNSGSGSQDRTSSDEPQRLTVTDTFLRDIPVPVDYRIVGEESYLYETRTGKVLAAREYDGRIAAESMANIYRREMRRHGWQLDTTNISSGEITQLYYKDNSVAAVTITSRFAGSTVSIRYSSFIESTPSRTTGESSPPPVRPEKIESTSESQEEGQLPQSEGMIYIDDLSR
ncbi:hypothetical protein [Desulfurispira natronophila]|uniref:Lipoprotein n=1 Tax=Desulfurispira natronophila TaxID=682562 RepID=A0A7W7Y4A3_9BACT|nr:hypothetical protein [Desulfurispira natronophila]MBB5021669.1 hypothetical protein [Desulfurispira natronophila]